MIFSGDSATALVSRLCRVARTTAADFGMASRMAVLLLVVRGRTAGNFGFGRRRNGRGRLTVSRGSLYHRGAEVMWVHSGCRGKLWGEPGVRCGVLEQSAGLVRFGANRNPYRHACC